MKRNITLVLIFTVLLSSCIGGGKKKRDKDFLPPLKIEIPASIAQDEELASLVKDSEKAINEFSDNMEALLKELEPFEDKKEEDLSTFETIKASKIITDFMMNNANALMVLEKIGDYANIRAKEQKPLNDEQMEAMAIIYDTFEARMKQLDEKYSEMEKKKE